MSADSSNQLQVLMSVLQDRAAPFGDRHDAAMDLGAFDGPEVEAALIAVACDPQRTLGSWTPQANRFQTSGREAA